MEHTEVMQQAVELALRTSCQGAGGPFGAAITKDGEVLCVASNSVLAECDPTAHAEINAIRQAGKLLGTHDLAGCQLYATGYPCPMCLSAIIWANIQTVYYGCTPMDAARIGFRDDFIYDYIVRLRGEAPQDGPVHLVQLDRAQCIQLFDEYCRNSRTIY